ncbi:MAG TPA: hypothetical protein VMB82_07260, partial [Acidimicrobiales bacterium]|nr:hypothetical protein [Acidimicrobiales bacterium]
MLTSGFDRPFAVSSDGTHVWVANDNNTVTELDAATGAVVQVLSGPSYHFGFADGLGEAGAIDSDGTHVWVADSDTNSVTELDAATGALVQVLSASRYGFDFPINLSSDGTHVWVSDDESNAVTEIDAATGALVQVISAASYGILQPTAIASDGSHVWVQNGTHFVGTGWTPTTITELDATTGALDQVISGIDSTDISSDGTNVWADASTTITEIGASTGAIVQTVEPSDLEYSQAISSDGTDVWAASTNDNEVVELDASSGAVVDEISGSGYGLDWPTGISSDGENVWVANTDNNSVTDLSTGVLVQRIIFTSASPTNALVGGSYTVSATGGASGNPVTFSIDPSATSVCSISGETVSFDAPGTCTVDANQAAGNGYPAATQAEQSFVVGAQIISFTSTPPTAATVGGPSYTVSATGGASGNPVTFSIDSSATSVCSASGATVTATGAGLCVVDANQAGGGGYAAAPQAEQSFLVGAQTITFTSTAPSDPPIGGTYVASARGGGSGNPVTFSSDDAATCTVSGSTFTFVGDGWCNIVANQAGNADWLPAAAVFQASLVGGIGGTGGSGGSGGSGGTGGTGGTGGAGGTT